MSVHRSIHMPRGRSKNRHASTYVHPHRRRTCPPAYRHVYGHVYGHVRGHVYGHGPVPLCTGMYMDMCSDMRKDMCIRDVYSRCLVPLPTRSFSLTFVTFPAPCMDVCMAVRMGVCICMRTHVCVDMHEPKALFCFLSAAGVFGVWAGCRLRQKGAPGHIFNAYRHAIDLCE